MTTNEDLARLSEVVYGRELMQHAAFELLCTIHQYRDRLVTDGFQSRCEELAAVAFSLWRAVFLIGAVGDQESVLSNAEAFLAKLVRDNIINYVDDWNNRAWSFGYYLGNAKYRIKQLCDTWPEYKSRVSDFEIPEALDLPAVCSLSDSIYVWQRHCRALQVGISLLQESFKAANRKGF